MKTKPDGAPAAQVQKAVKAAPPAAARPPKTNHQIADGEIAARAYQLYLARGACDGNDLNDWFVAEQQLRKERGLS